MNGMRNKVVKKGAKSAAHLPRCYKKPASSSCGRSKETMQPTACVKAPKDRRSKMDPEEGKDGQQFVTGEDPERELISYSRVVANSTRFYFNYCNFCIFSKPIQI